MNIVHADWRRAMRAVWAWIQHGSRLTVIAGSLTLLTGIGLALVAVEAFSVAHLDERITSATTRIYARPFVLHLTTRPSRSRVEDQLRRLGYTRTNRPDPGAGEYRLGSRTWVIGRRAFRHHERIAPAGKVRIDLDYAGTIRRLEDENGQRLPYVALEPELIGSVLGESQKDRTPVQISDVPDHLVEAVLSVEDQRFYKHHGLDLRRIAAAALANLRAGHIVQGASTLTQQLARNLYLSPRRSIIRKLREAAIAIVLEARHSKEEILEAYLNEVYLGQDGGVAIHGVGRAAQHYFDKDVSQLDLSESATLAGLIRGPSLYSPFRRPEAAVARRDLVLALMLERGVISDEDFLEASSAALNLTQRRGHTDVARYFIDHVGQRLRELGVEASEGGGLAVFTTLDMGLQRAAAEAVREGLAALEASYPALASEDVPLQAALVALDPGTGEILALVGGRDYGESQFNRAVKARRQPGSAFKPIVALAALSPRGWSQSDESRPFTLASVLDDERLVVETPQGPWIPVNYDQRFRGPISLREALERSLNVPFARLGMEVGPERIVETARRLGVESPLRAVPSIALGSNEVTPLELTRAYAILAAGGFRAELRATLGVLDRDGNVIERAEPLGEQVYDPAEAYLVTSALRGAVDWGTGRGLRKYGFDGAVAAKSGTTNDFRDGWFVGYTPSLAVGVWVGFDDGRTLGLPGSRMALPIFARFLVAAVGPDGDEGPYGGRGFSAPPGLEVVEVDPRTGLRAGPGCRGQPELFLTGTAPEESCSNFWRIVWPRRGDDGRRTESASRLGDRLLRLLERLMTERRGGGR